MKAILVSLLAAAPVWAWWFGPRFTSQKRQRPIAVDGEGRDWPTLERDDAADMTFSFSHDDEHLYVLFAPHTRGAKAQLGGAYGQDLSLWFDPGAGMARVMGARITAPQQAGTETVRLILAAGSLPGAREIEAKAGILDEHGVLEARIPIKALGSPTPKAVTVGLEAATPLRTPQPKTANPKDPASFELFAPLRLWVRVKLPK